MVPHLVGSGGEHFGRGVDEVDNHVFVCLPLLLPPSKQPSIHKPNGVTGGALLSQKKWGLKKTEVNLDVVIVLVAVVAEDALGVQVHGAGFRARGQGPSGPGRGFWKIPQPH